MPESLWNSRSTRKTAALAFIFLVFLTGGGSRGDLMSLPLLRGASVMFAAYALLAAPTGSWAAVRMPLVLLAGLAIIAVLQLIPMPPEMWTQLPQRDLVARLDTAVLGDANLWRPLSLSPARTWNMLLSLTVPFAAMLMAACVDRRDVPALMSGLLLALAVSMMIGIGQLAMGPGTGLYFYRITNDGSLVGLFANRNHHAMMLAAGVIVASNLLAQQWMASKPNGKMIAALASFIGVAAILTLVIGSRGGLLVLCVSVAAAWYQLVWARPAKVANKYSRSRSVVSMKAVAMAQSFGRLLPLWLFPLLAGLFLFSPQNNALKRLVTESPVESQRGESLPTLLDLASQHWLIGSGFGSFDPVFRIVEPDSILRPNYLNQAHNDWLQWLIEGGLPAIALALLTFFWLFRLLSGTSGFRSLLQARGDDLRFPLLVTLIVMALGSIGDYPLRVPSVQLLVVILIVLATRGQGLNAHSTSPEPRLLS